MKAKNFQPSILGITSVLVMVLSCVLGSGQPAVQQRDPRPTDLEKIASELRWRGLLDGLNDEARSLFPEHNRPYALAEVADAYWNLDKARSVEIFTTALDASLALKAGTRQASKAIRYVILVASKRDVNVARQMSERIAKERAKNDRPVSESVGAAIDLLTSDVKTAAQFAEAIAPAGLSSDSAGVFILELAQQDLNASDGVYRAYLNKVAANPGMPLNQLLWLGGYPFGYGETYSFSDKDLTRLIGMGGRRIPGLVSNPALGNRFLSVAYRSIQRTLREAELGPPERRDALSSVSLFATLYLLPEVERYSPNLSEAWWLLRQQAFAGVSEAQRGILEANVRMINSSRAAANNREESSRADSTEKIDSDFRDAEKMAAGCQRDRQFVNITLLIHSSKDDLRALRMAERIDNLSLRESVLQFLNYDISLSAVEAGDLPKAQQHAKRVAAPEQRGLLYVKMAGLTLRQKDRIRTTEFLSEARHVADNISDQATKTGVLLATATAFAKFDLTLTIEVLRDAIKAINRTKNPNVDGFTVLRKIELSCSDIPEDVWHGNSERAERFSFLGTLALGSSSDPEGILAMARDIEDPSVRIRAQASIIGTLATPKRLKSAAR